MFFLHHNNIFRLIWVKQINGLTNFYIIFTYIDRCIYFHEKFSKLKNGQIFAQNYLLIARFSIVLTFF